MEDYKKILAISGRPGLYKLIGQMKNGVIAESLDTGKRFPVYVSENISSLEDISIYTEDGELALKEIFLKINAETKGKAVDVKVSDTAKLKTYFEKLVPNYDKDRVYTSDIKKVIKWFNTLLEKNLLILKKEEEKKEKKATTEAKKPAAKKTTTKKKAEAKPKAVSKSKATTKKTSSKTAK